MKKTSIIVTIETEDCVGMEELIKEEILSIASYDGIISVSVKETKEEKSKSRGEE